jgi:hypothetical protein
MVMISWGIGRPRPPRGRVNGMERHMNNLIWLVGAVVIILFVVGYLGLR